MGCFSGVGVCHFQEQGWQHGGKGWLQPEPTHRMLGGSVTKVTATPRGGPAGNSAGATVATHPEFPWSNAVGLKERVDAGCWLGVQSVWAVLS